MVAVAAVANQGGWLQIVARSQRDDGVGPTTRPDETGRSSKAPNWFHSRPTLTREDTRVAARRLGPSLSSTDRHSAIVVFTPQHPALSFHEICVILLLVHTYVLHKRAFQTGNFLDGIITN